MWVKSRRGCRNGEDFEESHRPFQIFIEILHLETRLNKKLRVLVNEEDVIGIEKEGMGFGR